MNSPLRSSPLPRILCILLLVMSAIALAAQPVVLRGGDRVKVVCEEEASITKEYTITRDGLIVLPFVGALQVAGLSERDAADSVSKRLVAEGIVRKATVTVTRLSSSSAGVRFSGAIKLSGETPYRDGMRLSDIISLAGPTDDADLARIEVQPAQGRRIVVRYSAEQQSSEKANPFLRPGDRVLFPVKLRPDEISVFGAVKNPQTLSFSEGLTLDSAIRNAGGVAASADPEAVQLDRQGSESMMLSLQRHAAFKLQPGDRIVVNLKTDLSYVQVDGEVMRPGAVVFRPGIRLSDAIMAVGGPTTRAKVDKVRLYRMIEGRQVASEHDANGIFRGMTADVMLKPGDRITVPSARSGKGSGGLVRTAVGAVLLYLILSR